MDEYEDDEFDNNDEYEKELDEYLKRIKSKMDENPELKDEVENLILRLSDIFESEIDLSIKFDLNVEEYRNEFIKYDDDEFHLASEEIMRLEDLKSLIEDEEQHLHLSIDPIYLKKGINDVKDMLITTYENKIILVPVTEKK